MSALDFSLTLFVHETQMQHGLRAENHDRYHCYLSNRVAKLREQLKLSNDKKKFLNKDITPAIAKSPKHLMLLALYAERCWTAAECLQETRRAVARASHSEGTQPPGGCPPSDQFRKRLNKAVKWAEKLKTVAAAVGSERVQAECCGYFLEVSGRASLSHGLYEDAREKFYAAREKYYQLLATSADEERGVVVRKVNELDDRVTYCMQRLGQDPTTYSPPVAASGQEGSTTIQWNGRQLSVTSMKVKDALREAREVPVESVQQRVLSTPGPVAVGHTTKVLDLLDRRINYYNDALAHARQDLRTAVEGAHKTELQLLEHFFHYQVSHETLRRTLFMTEVYARRFHATEGALLRASSAKGRSRKGAIVEGQYASPAEVVRLFEVGLEAIDAMELLPGVSGREEVMHYTALCQAGRLIYTGESWRVSGNTTAERSAATRCYNTAVALLQPFNTPRATELREYAERRSLQLAAESVGQTSSSTASATVPFLSEALKAKTGVVAVAEAVVRFPPDFQAAPCKPVFVDVAATYVDFGHLTESSSAPAAGTSATAAAADGAKSEKKWGWGWRS